LKRSKALKINNKKRIIEPLALSKAKHYLMLIACIILLESLSAKAQENVLGSKISIELKNISIEKALSLIEKKINYNFTFDASLVNSKEKVSLHFKNKTVSKCLDSIFFDKELIYTVIDNHIVIKQKAVKFIEDLPKDTLNKNVEIRGKLIDIETNEAVPFATVSVKNYSIGVISNLEGEFILKIPSNLINEDLLVSHIGYENLIEKIHSFQNKYSLFYLKQSFVPIQEVVIRNTDAKTLLRLALNKIDENYGTKPNYLTAFYRETIKRGDTYMFFSEALLQVYKSEYSSTYEQDQIKVLKSRKMKNVTLRDTVVLKIKSGLQSVLFLDVVKTRIDFLLEENFHLYNYKMADIVTYNDKTSYAIDFEQKGGTDGELYMGTIYIDTDNLAIVGAEFQINPRKIDKAQSRFVVKKTRGMKLRLLDTKYIVSYRSSNGKFYLSHVRGELKFKVKKNNKLFPIIFDTVLEMAVSDIDSSQVVKFSRKEAEDLSDIFADVQHKYDETFWEEYNFIKPEDSWQEAIKKIHEKMNLKDF